MHGFQAGAQLQHVTGGHVLAGFHEVVVGPRTIAALERCVVFYAVDSWPPPLGPHVCCCVRYGVILQGQGSWQVAVACVIHDVHIASY